MTTNLFTNVVMVHAPADEVTKILADPKHLLQWVPEISTVDQGQNGFIIKRDQTALNQSELIKVTITAGEITYTSTQGRLEYRLVFTVTSQNDQSVIQEDLYLPDDTDRHLPIKLLAPIAKHAFHTNLIHLGALVELMATKRG